MRSNLFSLRQKKIDLAETNRSLLDKAKAQGRELSASEVTTFDANIVSLKRVDADLAEAEAARERDINTPGMPDENSLFSRAAGNHVPNAGVDTNHSSRLRAGRGFHELFGPAGQRSTHGFTSLGEYFQAFHNAPQQFDPRLKMAGSSNVEGVPSGGGFLVPEEFAQQILLLAMEQSIVLPRCQQWAMASEVRKIPGLDNFDHRTNLFGGYIAAWTPEATSVDPQSLKSFQVSLNARKLMILGNVSSELLEDAVGTFESVYGASMTAATAWYLDECLLNSGDGAGRPRSILNDPALVVVPKQSWQAANSIVFENVAGMWARLHPASAANAVWIANSTCIPQLLLMQNRVFNVAGDQVVGGSAVPIVTQQNGKLYMLGREILTTEKTPVVGDQGDLILTDLTQYAVGMRRAMSLEKSLAPGFTNDTVYFRVTLRCDGQGVWKGPMSPKNGDTLSWAVCLAAR